eukprot:3417175-Rhodomonas_salina.3
MHGTRECAPQYQRCQGGTAHSYAQTAHSHATVETYDDSRYFTWWFWAVRTVCSTSDAVTMPHRAASAERGTRKVVHETASVRMLRTCQRTRRDA